MEWLIHVWLMTGSRVTDGEFIVQYVRLSYPSGGLLRPRVETVEIAM